MSLKKSNICIFFHSIWKNLHLTEIFYTDMSVVSVTNMRYETKYKLTSTPPPSIAPLYNCGNRYGCKSNITAPISSCCSSPSPLTSSPRYFHHHPYHDIFCGLNLWHRRHGGHHHLHHHARHLLSLKELSRKQRISKICC